MGHLVNPINYRVGSSKCWNSAWFQNITFSSNYSSLIKADFDIFLFFRRFFDLKLLVQSGYIFSHVKIIRERTKVFCIVYFYDGGSLERADNIRHIFLSADFQLFLLTNIFFLSLSSFLKLYSSYSSNFRVVRDFKFVFLFEYFNQKKRLFFSLNKIKTLIFLNLVKLLKKNLKFLFVKELDCVNFFDFDFIFSSDEKNFKQIFLNSKFFMKLNIPLDFVFLFFFFMKKCLFIKIKLNDFFFSDFFKFFMMLRWNLFRRSSSITKMIHLCINYFSFNRYFLYYFSDVLFFSTRVHSRLSTALQTTFKRLYKPQNFSKWQIVLKKLEITELNAAIISKYLAVRLRQRFQLREILMPVIRHLTNTYFVKGFRIVCAGRFTRKEIALYDLRTYSSVPFSGVSSHLDFSLAEVVLKYSICGIKVWLHRDMVSENFFSIHGIGMNFIQTPLLAFDFRTFLKSKIAQYSKPYHSSSKLDNILINVLCSSTRFKNQNVSKNNRLVACRNFFAISVFKFAPVVDFFFSRLSFFSKKNLRNLKIKKVNSKNHLKKFEKLLLKNLKNK